MAEEAELKAGLEIHQQLDTKKLFCSCPSILRIDKPDYVVTRKLHVVAGEFGKIDEAARHEAEKGNEFEYECYHDNTCLVELDEEPPHLINENALRIALQIALLLNCEVMPYTQVMRKTVIDGSNTSGFQRTVMIAKKGYVDTEYGRVGIDGVFLEEDAARIIAKGKNKVVYRLDRLGIPLVEITTCPDIKNAKQVREVALHIGEILRACRVKRGIGTIRQDVNISVKWQGKWGKRVELKGVQELALIEKAVIAEAERQKKLIEREESVSEVRNASADGTSKFLRPMPGASRMYPETDLPILRLTREMINNVKSDLPKLRSEIRGELKNKGLSDEMIKLILQENKLEEFRELTNVSDNLELIVKLIVLWKKEIAVKMGEEFREVDKRVSIDVIETILNHVKTGKIDEGKARIVLERIIDGKTIEEAMVFEELKDIDKEIEELVRKKPGLSMNAYMGLVMSRYKGKISGKSVIEILKKYLQ